MGSPSSPQPFRFPPPRAQARTRGAISPAISTALGGTICRWSSTPLAAA